MTCKSRALNCQHDTSFFTLEGAHGQFRMLLQPARYAGFFIATRAVIENNSGVSGEAIEKHRNGGIAGHGTGRHRRAVDDEHINRHVRHAGRGVPKLIIDSVRNERRVN